MDYKEKMDLALKNALDAKFETQSLREKLQIAEQNRDEKSKAYHDALKDYATIQCGIPEHYLTSYY